MVPFVEEYKVGVKNLLGSAHRGSHAIIMALDEPRALLVEVDGIDGNWVYGRIKFHKIRYPLPALTFSRPIHTPCVFLTYGQSVEMADSYESMFVKYD